MTSPTARCEIEVAGEILQLLPEGAVLWPRRSTLFVADVHLGKAASFRAAALPLPLGTTEATLLALSTALGASEAQRLVVLGDLWHARVGRTEAEMQLFAGWRGGHSGVEMVLVEGNHDRRSGDLLPEWAVTQVEEPATEGPFALRHYPEPTEGFYTLAGHLHPAAILQGGGGQRLRLPCFWFGSHVGILPAFGAFTGTATAQPAAGDRVFVVAEGRVLSVGT